MCAGKGAAEVGTPGAVGELVTVSGGGLMFTNMSIFKSLNHPEYLVQQQSMPLSDWAAFFLVKDTLPF